MWASIPSADLRERPDEEMNRVVARARVLASRRVYVEFATFRKWTATFNRLHADDARLAGASTPGETRVSPPLPDGFVAAIAQAVDEMRASYHRIETVIRAEMGERD